MRVVTLNLDTLEFEDFEPGLRSLAQSAGSLEAAKDRMLWNLIRHLRKSGPEPQVFAYMISGELYFRPAEAPKSATVTIHVDWYDYGPIEDGLPRMHYRINVKDDEQELSRDMRTDDLVEVERVVLEVFGWNR